MSGHQEVLEKKFAEIDTPFAASLFPKKVPRKEINQFLEEKVQQKLVQKKKIGSMYVYWKETAPEKESQDKAIKKPTRKTAPPASSDVDSKITALQRKIERLESENAAFKDHVKDITDKLEEEKDRNARLRKIDAIDEISSEWEEIAYRMGEAIAYQRGMSLKEVLKKFGAPDD